MQRYETFSDSELSHAISENNEQAFKTLYFRYYDKLFYFIWYRIHSTEIAKDITQELFSRVWHNRSTLNPQKSIKAYLYRIANNLVINHVQRRNVEKRYLSDIPNEKFISRTTDNFDLKEKIHTAIETLPDKAKTVFVLHRYEGFTYSEMATSLGVSIKTIEKRMSLALKELRIKLRPYLNPDEK